MNKRQAIALAEEYRNLPTFRPLVLPVPTSKNNLHVRGNRRGFHTSEHTRFRRDVKTLYRVWGQRNRFKTFEGSKYLHLKFRYQLFRETHKGDPKNHEQALLDSLKGMAWTDDAFIHLDNVLPDDPDQLTDKENPRCILWLNPIQISCTKIKRRTSKKLCA